MSYDVHVNCHTCGNDLVRQTNMTSNLSKMWTEAGAPLKDFDGKTAFEVLPLLQRAIESLTDDALYYQQFVPDNGWGDLKGCIEYLKGLRDACAKEPFATVAVCR